MESLQPSLSRDRLHCYLLVSLKTEQINSDEFMFDSTIFPLHRWNSCIPKVEANGCPFYLSVLSVWPRWKWYRKLFHIHHWIIPVNWWQYNCIEGGYTILIWWTHFFYGRSEFWNINVQKHCCLWARKDKVHDASCSQDLPLLEEEGKKLLNLILSEECRQYLSKYAAENYRMEPGLQGGLGPFTCLPQLVGTSLIKLDICCKIMLFLSSYNFSLCCLLNTNNLQCEAVLTEMDNYDAPPTFKTQCLLSEVLLSSNLIQIKLLVYLLVNLQIAFNFQAIIWAIQKHRACSRDDAERYFYTMSSKVAVR